MRHERAGTTSVLVTVLAAFVAVACSPSSPDDGFVGRWKRENSEREISIGRDGDAWTFCQAGTSGQMRERTECVDGRLSEVHRGVEIVYTFTYEIETRGEDELQVLVQGEPLTQEDSPIQSLERFRLSADGATLWRWTLAVDGRRFFPPRGPFRYGKISNRPYR